MTALQELIEDLKSVGIKFNTEKYLEKEKQQLSNAFHAGETCESLCHRGYDLDAIPRKEYVSNLYKLNVETDV